MPTTKPTVPTGINTARPGSSGPSAPTPGTGIHNPATQHRFVVRVEGTPQQFSMQTCAFAMNFAKQELCMLVEQSLTGQTKEHEVIQDMIDNPGRQITLEILDHAGSVSDTIKFIDCKIEDHSIDFNYASQSSAVHVLIMSYQKIDLGAGKAQAAYASAMSIIGKP